MSDPTDLPGVSAWPEPVTFERLQQTVAALGLNVTTTQTQRLSTRIENNVIEMSVAAGKNTVVRVLGMATTRVPAEQEAVLATFANNWHRERTWPTLLWTPADDGNLTLRSVYTIDFTAGATNQQLSTAVRVGISASTKGLNSAREALQTGTTEPELG